MAQIFIGLAPPPPVPVVAQDPEQQYLEVEKTWQAIHFLLTGDTYFGEPPLCKAVQGGRELGTVDVGYGPAKYLEPAEVKEVAAALQAISRAALMQRYSGAELTENDVYTPGGRWDDDVQEADEYIGQHYEYLVEFFTAAAARNHAIIFYLN